MSSHRDPPRLFEPDSPAEPWLRDVLRVTSTSTPSAAQLEALALKVGAATLAPVTAGAVIKTQNWLAKVGMAKLSVALLIAAGAAWLGFSELANESAQRTEPRAPFATLSQAPAQAEREAKAATARGHAAVAAATTRDAHSVAAPAVTAQVLEPQPSHSHLRASRSGRPADDSRTKSAVVPQRALLAGAQRMTGAALEASQAPAARRSPIRNANARGAVPEDAAPVATPAADAPSELSLLSRAQGLLARAPEAALETIDEHARLYPHGEFVQEREALAIDALRRLGRRPELQARARAFLQRYPASPHRDRIEAQLR